MLLINIANASPKQTNKDKAVSCRRIMAVSYRYQTFGWIRYNECSWKLFLLTIFIYHDSHDINVNFSIFSTYAMSPRLAIFAAPQIRRNDFSLSF